MVLSWPPKEIAQSLCCVKRDYSAFGIGPLWHET